MRLICPSCGAQYDIDTGLIPASGREVECSSCGHVWHQIGTPSADTDATASAPSAPPQGEQDDAAPQLNRPLAPDILEILREEAAREIDLRHKALASESAQIVAPSTPRDKPTTPPADHDHGMPDAPIAAKVELTMPRPPAGPTPPEEIWPAMTVTAPDESEPRRIIPGKSVPPAPAPQLAEAPSRKLAEEALDSDETPVAPLLAPRARSAAPVVEHTEAVPPPPPVPTPSKDEADTTEDLATQPSTASTAAQHETALPSSPNRGHARPARPLPDADALARTLAPMPPPAQAAPADAAPSALLQAPAAAAELHPASHVTPQATPDPRPAPRYALGFALGALVMLGVLAIYLIGVAQSPAPYWIERVDAARQWLDHGLMGLLGRS